MTGKSYFNDYAISSVISNILVFVVKVIMR